MKKKIKYNKKLYVAKPLKHLAELEVCYISSSHIFLMYDDTITPEQYQFIISKRASFIKFPDTQFDMKVILENGKYIVDESIFYSKNLVLEPVPSIFYDMNFFYHAQKINYAYFARKRGTARLSFKSSIDELIVLADSAYKYGKLDQEDQGRFDYLIGWTETRMPKWANGLSISAIIKEIDIMNDELSETRSGYEEEDILEKDFHPCDLTLTVFFKEIIEALEQKVIATIQTTPKAIIELNEEYQAKVVSILHESEKWETLKEIKLLDIKVAGL